MGISISKLQIQEHRSLCVQPNWLEKRIKSDATAVTMSEAVIEIDHRGQRSTKGSALL